MEHFVIIVNGFQPLTIITKRSNLDVPTALDPSLIQRVQEELQGTLSVSDFSDICSLFLVTNDKSILYHDNIKQISLNNDFSDSHNPRRIIWGAVQKKVIAFSDMKHFCVLQSVFFFCFFFLTWIFILCNIEFFVNVECFLVHHQLLFFCHKLTFCFCRHHHQFTFCATSSFC